MVRLDGLTSTNAHILALQYGIKTPPLEKELKQRLLGLRNSFQELEKELALLKIQNSNLCNENEKLKCETAKLKKGIREVIKMTPTFSLKSLLCTQEEKSQIDTDEKFNENDDPALQSIRDRFQHITSGYITNRNFGGMKLWRLKGLPIIGKKMAAHYRETHNGENPAKRDEKIKDPGGKNDGHCVTVSVCVYSEVDWEYMDYLITTELFGDVVANLKYPFYFQKIK